MSQAHETTPPWLPGRPSPARLLRRPLTWLVAGELVAMLALFAFAWHIWQSHAQTRPALARLPLPALSPLAPASPTPAAHSSPVVQKPTPRPGLATGPAIWTAQLGAINSDQAAWHKAEWSLIQAALQAIREYVDRVVMPAVRRAQELPVNSS
jgi:hypothetical protein